MLTGLHRLGSSKELGRLSRRERRRRSRLVQTDVQALLNDVDKRVAKSICFLKGALYELSAAMGHCCDSKLNPQANQANCHIRQQKRNSGAANPFQ